MADLIYAGDAGVFKTCSHCAETKSLHEFRKDARRLVGRCSVCSECNRRLSSAHRQANLGDVKRRRREARIVNPERAREIDKARYARESEKRKKNATDYYWRNRDKVLARLTSEKGRANARNRMRAKMQDPSERAYMIISRAIRASIGDKKRRHWESLVGYSLADLMQHIERQFLRGMTWGNYGRGDGKWHIDHILPKSSFAFASADDLEFKACWALTNLRPMWGKDNISKHAKRLYLL